MGYCKVVVNSERSVTLVHQLNPDGSAYAEDVTIELQPGVDASRLGYLRQREGQIGVLSFSFSPADDLANPGEFRFPSVTKS